jgi:hypothetical protein
VTPVAAKRPKELRLASGYDPLEPQQAFRTSTARIRGYGGAMGGGKSRALCEEAFDLALDHPGIKIPICRLRHTSIIETTKKTMVEEVLPIELLAHPATKRKESGGEDYIRLPNGSVFHFIGLEDPIRWFSSNLGALVFDEAHEIDEDTVVKLITRLRQSEAPLVELPDGSKVPGRVMIGFNPENPGHWLQRWFILGASRTKFGFVKPELWATGATKPLGTAEFIFAKATDNIHLPEGYVESTLGALPEMLRRRYLEGEWLYTSGTTFFDNEALADYTARVGPPRWKGVTAGDISGRDPTDKLRVRPTGDGLWHVWEAPIRARHVDGRNLPAHRYLVTVDVSSGGSTDFSAIQVIDVEEFAQVAEFQGKLDPDLLALEAFRIGAIYNSALVAPEVTGGWGMTIITELKRLFHKASPAVPRPRLYTRRVRDRLSDQFTDKLGWDTTTKTRYVMLDTLERVLREREFELRSERALAELVSFVRPEKKATDLRDKSPRAQPGTNDDLVITLAMGVTLATQLPRQIRRVREPERVPAFPATGY